MSRERRRAGGDEAELVRQLGRGRRQEFEEAARVLFRRHYGALVDGVRRSFARLDAGTAEEVAVDALVRLFEDPERYDPEISALQTYLNVIARNLARDRLRRESRVDHLPLSALPKVIRREDRPPRCPGGWRRRRALIQAIQELPTAAGAAAELRLRGYTIAEIAEELGCTVGTARTRLSRATARLRDCLGTSAKAQPP